jgi:ubiquinone/menaquinone biosynthesis C-methylase UbiE
LAKKMRVVGILVAWFSVVLFIFACSNDIPPDASNKNSPVPSSGQPILVQPEPPPDQPALTQISTNNPPSKLLQPLEGGEFPIPDEILQRALNEFGYDPRMMLQKSRSEVLLTDKVMQKLQLSEGMTVVDVGAGLGYFTFRFAEKVGKDGKVYALEIRDYLVDLLKRRTDDRKLNPHENVFPLLSRINDTTLPEESIDVAFLCEVHFHVAQKLPEPGKDMVASLFRTVKKGGRLVVLEMKQNPAFPPYTAKDIAQHYIDAGFKLVELDNDHTPQMFYISLSKP